MTNFVLPLATVALTLLASIAVRPALAADCAAQDFEGGRYTVCTVDPATADLRLFWQDDDKQPFRDFSRVADAVAKQGRTLIFAMNAGMFENDFSPVGLYIENGTELRPANEATRTGTPAQIPNFYKKPNGVFYIGADGAGILPTKTFLEQKPNARFATQSGPMLMISGEVHPAFIPGSTDRTRRDGVGICDGGKLVFAISENGVNFHDFARLFRDELKCPNALFLDGGRGVGLYQPALNRNDRSGHGGFGPIFGILE